MARVVWDEDKHPRIPGDGPGGAPGGRWTTIGGAAAAIGSAASGLGSAFNVGSSTLAALGLKGVKKAARIHKAGYARYGPGRGRRSKATMALYDFARAESGKIPSGFGNTRNNVYKDILKNTGVKMAEQAANVALKQGSKAAINALGQSGHVQYVHKSSVSPKGYGSQLAGTHFSPFEAPTKAPSSIGKTDERGLKINLYVGKVTKKRRPTFPNGYNKNRDFDI